MRIALALALLAVLVSTGQANPMAIVSDAPPPREDGGWIRMVAVPCSLQWGEQGFTGPLEFRFRADTLRVNGVVVEIDREPVSTKAAPKSREQLHLHVVLTAGSFDEWVDAYRESEFVERLRVGSGSIEVVWVDSEKREWEILHYPGVTLGSLYRRTWSFVNDVALELERGVDVLVIRGVAAFSMEGRWSEMRSSRRSKSSWQGIDIIYDPESRP